MSIHLKIRQIESRDCLGPAMSSLPVIEWPFGNAL